MKKLLGGSLAAACVAVAMAGGAGAASAQMAEVKEKPAMYSYLASWTLPRVQWAEMEKANAAMQKVLDRAVASGALVGYGSDSTLIHTADGPTHDDWWSSMSMAGLLNVLDEMYKSGNASMPVLSSATRHWDGLYVSHYYNWRPGNYTGAYTHVGFYKVKADAPDDAFDSLAKSFVVPLMEKLLAEGALVEYEIDQEAIHTASPDMFYIDYITKDAAGLDKVNAAIQEMLKSTPLSGQAFSTMLDSSAHSDTLSRTSAVYK
jgi:hypothetical protein